MTKGCMVFLGVGRGADTHTGEYIQSHLCNTDLSTHHSMKPRKRGKCNIVVSHFSFVSHLVPVS